MLLSGGLYGPKVGPAVMKARKVSFEAGNKIVDGSFSRGGGADDGKEKSDKNVGHHAIVTRADISSQNLIIKSLGLSFPKARFILEEKSKILSKRIITDDKLATIGAEELIFNVDALDGTSSRNSRLYEWAVSIGVMGRDLRHVGGSIYAPDVCGGLQVYGERGMGVFAKDGYTLWQPVRVRTITERKNSFVFIGPDIFFMLDKYGRFLNEISKQVRTTNANGSCALPLAGIACGRIDALIEPVQCPWDWAAGYPLVEEAGGKVLFYHYPKGRPERLMLAPACYSSTKRNAAFIAGNPDIVDWLWDMLRENWNLPCKEHEIIR